MIENVDKYVEFLEQHELTTDEFLILYLIGLEDYKNIKKYLENNPERLLKDHQISKLISNGLITIKNYNKDQTSLNLRNIQLSSKFKNKIIIDKEEAAKELWDSYFNWLLIDGKKVAAKNIIFDEFVEIYSKIIKNNKKEHERILDITRKYVKSNEYADMGLSKYIGTRHYDLIQEESLSNLGKIRMV